MADLADYIAGIGGAAASIIGAYKGTNAAGATSATPGASGTQTPAATGAKADDGKAASASKSLGPLAIAGIAGGAILALIVVMKVILKK